METAFKAIGIDVSGEYALEELAQDVGKRGEASRLVFPNGLMHGRCIRAGSGFELRLEYVENKFGELSETDCRPAFRARYPQKITSWHMNDITDRPYSIVIGRTESGDVEMLFQVQNLTEVEPYMLEEKTLNVGLCGLTYFAKVRQAEIPAKWNAHDFRSRVPGSGGNDWDIAGYIAACEEIENPLTSDKLYWMIVSAGLFNLEIIVNAAVLKGRPRVGSYIDAVVWLQGHIVAPERRRRYEGPDMSVGAAEHWQQFRRLN